MQIKKLELNGFKSFVERTSFFIEKGLTGIVGPNGCGKSNIVESLRWVMGETSAKSMRGSGMEDVIFSGTSNKPSKNIAEVSVAVSNNNNEVKEAERINDLLQPVHKALFAESNPAPVKYAAKLLGLCDDAVRLPLVKIMDETKLKVKNSLISAKLLNE